MGYPPSMTAGEITNIFNNLAMMQARNLGLAQALNAQDLDRIQQLGLNFQDLDGGNPVPTPSRWTVQGDLETIP